MNNPTITVTRVSEGLGFGDGSISARAVESRPGNKLVASQVDTAIASPHILHAVEADDDGCGDGRSVSDALDAITSQEQTFRRSLCRAKVFGGGVMMAVAARIGLQQVSGKSLTTVVDDAIAALVAAGIHFGAHTDTQTEAPNCGCGAIDRAPLIVAAVATYRKQIAATVAALGLTTGVQLEAVLDGFALQQRSIGSDYSGQVVMDKIKASGAVVKRLAESHLETRIVLNMVEGYTVDQGFVRDQTEDRAQVFAVDIWRLRQLAHKLYEHAPERAEDLPAVYEGAFLGMIVYTLATAAVLTEGDLPVYVIERAS